MSSCGSSCGSCGTTEEGDNVNTSIDQLIDNLQTNWSVPLDQPESYKWDLQFNELGLRISNNNAQSLKPLVAIYNDRGPKGFLDVVRNLRSMNMIGHLIAWAFEFCQNDVDQFVKMVRDRDEEMINHVNKRAEFFECFSENPKVGRATKRLAIKDQEHDEPVQTKKDEDPTTRSSFDKNLAIAFLVSVFLAIIWQNI